MNDHVHAASAPKAVGRYPHARRAGNLLFLSGIGPRDPRDDSIPGDIAGQCHSVFANVKAVLEASGATWADLVDVTVYLTDMARDFNAYNATWAEYFPHADSAPCRTTLGITSLRTIFVDLLCKLPYPTAMAKGLLLWVQAQN